VPLQFAAAWIGTWIARHQDRTIEYLKTENRLLVEKLSGRVRLTDPERRRLARLAKPLGRKTLREVASIASPDTILRWYRDLVATKYDGTPKRGPGRPPQPAKIVGLLLKMAEENPRWGYTRFRGALRNDGFDVGRNTIKRILKEHSIDPAPLRRKRTSWMTFIKAHLGAIASADVFTVEVVSLAGLVRYHVFFLIDIASRKVEIAGITSRLDGSWMDQIPRGSSANPTPPRISLHTQGVGAADLSRAEGDVSRLHRAGHPRLGRRSGSCPRHRHRDRGRDPARTAQHQPL
jgi:putative transposase